MKTLLLLLGLLIFGNLIQAQPFSKHNWHKALITSEIFSGNSDTIHKTINVVQADSIIKANNDSLVIIDVRTPEEYAVGHLVNALNINIYDSTFNAEIDSLNRDLKYLVYCQAGSRSAQAFSFMVLMKFREVYNMSGGFKKWKADGYPYDVDTSNSIEESKITSVLIYPNPATALLTIELNQPVNSSFINIYSINGQEQYCNRINDVKTELNISELKPGLYFLKISTANSVISRSFIKK